MLAYDSFAKEIPEYIELVEHRDQIFKERDCVSLHVPAAKEASTRSSASSPRPSTTSECRSFCFSSGLPARSCESKG